MKPQIPKRLGRVSALAPQTALCLCLCLHMYHAFTLPQKRFSKLSTQLWPSWLLLPSMNAPCEPCACLFACDTHLSITSHSLQSISCLTNGNWGPEVVLKFIFSKPQRGWGGHLSYPLWPRYFQTFPGSLLSWETILGCLLWHTFLNIPATGQRWAGHLSCFISSSQTSLKQAKSFSHT